jgi:hypothetical protein
MVAVIAAENVVFLTKTLVCCLLFLRLQTGAAIRPNSPQVALLTMPGLITSVLLNAPPCGGC